MPIYMAFVAIVDINSKPPFLLIKEIHEPLMAILSACQLNHFTNCVFVLLLGQLKLAELSCARGARTCDDAVAFDGIPVCQFAVECEPFVFRFVAVAYLVQQVPACFVKRIAVSIVVLPVRDDVLLLFVSKLVYTPNVAMVAVDNREYTVYIDVFPAIPIPRNNHFSSLLNFAPLLN